MVISITGRRILTTIFKKLTEMYIFFIKYYVKNDVRLNISCKLYIKIILKI